MASGQAGRLADRILMTDNKIAPSQGGAQVDAMIRFVAQTARVPIGLEIAPEVLLPPRIVPRPMPPTVQVEGMTVRAVLDLIRQVDSRYEWRESGLLIEVAPTAVRQDVMAPLNRRIAPLALVDIDAPAALIAVRKALDPQYELPTSELTIGPAISPTAVNQGQRPFSVRFAGGTVRDLLNAIVSAHADLYWIVSYDAPPARVERLTLTFRSFDGWGLASPPDRRR